MNRVYKVWKAPCVESICKRIIITIDDEIYNDGAKGLNTPVDLKDFFSLGTRENELAR